MLPVMVAVDSNVPGRYPGKFELVCRALTVPKFRSSACAPERLPEVGPTLGWRCQQCCGAVNARNMESTSTLKRQTAFSIELINVLRISMLPRDDTQKERTNKKRLLGRFPRANHMDLSAVEQLDPLPRSKLYHEFVILADIFMPKGPGFRTLHH